MKRIFGIWAVLCVLSSSFLFAQSAPDFTLTSTKGEEITLSSLRGKKVLIDFFATWCPPCRKGLEVINKIVTENKGGNFEIICVSVDSSMRTVKKYIEKRGHNMTVLFDNKNVANEYGVRSIPAMFLIDEEGNVAWDHVGLPTEELLKKVLDI